MKKKKNYKALLAGTFDNFHVGHQWLLWQAKQMSNEMVVIIARDQTVQKIKNQPPRNTEKKRLERVESENLPNTTTRLGRSDADFLATISEENPDVIILGYDQKFYTEKCKQTFPNIKIIRLDPYNPDFFKSSKF